MSLTKKKTFDVCEIHTFRGWTPTVPPPPPLPLSPILLSLSSTSSVLHVPFLTSHCFHLRASLMFALAFRETLSNRYRSHFIFLSSFARKITFCRFCCLEKNDYTENLHVICLVIYAHYVWFRSIILHVATPCFLLTVYFFGQLLATYRIRSVHA